MGNKPVTQFRLGSFRASLFSAAHHGGYSIDLSKYDVEAGMYERLCWLYPAEAAQVTAVLAKAVDHALEVRS